MSESGRNAASLALGEEPIPTAIDRYEILRKLATGGMAELFLAKQSGLEGFEKVVVIKRILSHLAQDEEFVSMFLDEARIAAKLSHPNIVQIYDLGKADDSYYIAMEYVSGRNVQHIMAKQLEQSGTIPVEHACRMIAGVCEGLHYAHSRKDYDGRPLNIVHRDISPQNILVSFAGGVKVVDFGIAKASTQLAQTRAGVLKGKYAYMSPEQVRGQKVDHRSDLFALGLVFYEMLTGRRAFERESSLKTLKAIVQEKPLNPRELNPEVPVEVVKLLSRALEKNPDRRYKNAQDFQLAIEDYLETSPKKSNNVRLSRYLYDLFEDELKSEQGTMIVEGVGEVIIPTGVGKVEKREESEEEVDAKTLSAALLPEAPPGRRSLDDDAPEPARGPAAAGRKLSEPGVRVVRDDKVSGSGAAVSGDALDGPSLEDLGLSEDDLESDADESGDDKTIPVYSLEEYERQREERGLPPLRDQVAAAGIDTSLEDAGRDDASFDSDATVGGISPQDLLRSDGAGAAGGSIDNTSTGPVAGSVAASRRAGGFTDESNVTVDDVRAAELLAKVEAMAEGAGLSRTGPALPAMGPASGPVPDVPAPSGPVPAASGAPPRASAGWEASTHETELGHTAEAPGSQLYSSESVVGPNGPVRMPAQVAPAIRPPGAPDSAGRPAASADGIRPAASADGIRPAARPTARRGAVRDIAPPASAVSRANPVADSGLLPVADGPLEATPATARQPAAGPKSGPPMALIAALGAMGLFVLLSIVAVVVLVVVSDDAPADGAPKATVRVLKLDTKPPGAEISYGTVTHVAPAMLLVPPGVVTVTVTHNGKRSDFQLKVPEGSDPLEQTIELER